MTYEIWTQPSWIGHVRQLLSPWKKFTKWNTFDFTENLCMDTSDESMLLEYAQRSGL